MKEDSLTQHDEKGVRWLPSVVGMLVLCVVTGTAQTIHEQGSDLGPRLEWEPPTLETDYIRIAPLPGNNSIEGACTRVQGTGLPQYLQRFTAYAWNNGPNGIPESGGGDDINLGRILPNWSTDVPPNLGTIYSNGVFEAAIDYTCGQGLVFADYWVYRPGEGFEILNDSASISVIPPDWLPDVPQNLRKVGADKQ
jgi:hypothetical protein